MGPETRDKDCIFCKIIAGDVPTDFIYRDGDVVVFRDIKPLTPVHLLVVTVRHIASLAEMDDADTPLVGRMVRVANRVAREHGIAEGGYRVTINSGADSGQIVPHLHMHLMGGRRLRWEH